MPMRFLPGLPTLQACLWLCTALGSHTPQAAQPTVWPPLPETNATVVLPAQEWPARPGPRHIEVFVHFPRHDRANLQPDTGILLTLHNWGGTRCIGTADPQVLADQLNLVTLCVNYLQSGAKDSIEGPEPYDFGYLQALDALRALWWTRDQLLARKIPFNPMRLHVTGGSGGGNVALMCGKLAPRTFQCVVDLCGMKKLSDDIAFDLPGGSKLNARYSRDPASPNILSKDAQELRFVGNPRHLAIQHALAPRSLTITVHGVDDTTCPFADAVEMVRNFQKAGLRIEPHFIGKQNLDGTVFTASGHDLGDRTAIVLQVAGGSLRSQPLTNALGQHLRTEFDLQETLVYPTTHGEFQINYSAGYPVGHFKKSTPPAPDAK